MNTNFKIDFVNFNKLDDETLKLVWKWRTSDQIRSKMTDQRVFSLEEHMQFCVKLKERNDVLFVLVYCNDTPIGVLTYKEIDLNSHSCVPGCYFVNAPKNVSSLASIMMGDYLYNQGIYVFRAIVLKNNIQALLFNTLKCNYKIVREDDLYYYLEYNFSKFDGKIQQKEADYVNSLLQNNNVKFNI